MALGEISSLVGVSRPELGERNTIGLIGPWGFRHGVQTTDHKSPQPRHRISLVRFGWPNVLKGGRLARRWAVEIPLALQVSNDESPDRPFAIESQELVVAFDLKGGERPLLQKVQQIAAEVTLKPQPLAAIGPRLARG